MSKVEGCDQKRKAACNQVDQFELADKEFKRKS